MKKSLLIVLIVVLILGVTTVFGASFSDIDGHWAENVIEEMSKEGILNGFEDGTFKPNERITREQFAKILVESLKVESKNTDGNYVDIENDRWSRDYINRAKDFMGDYWIDDNKYFKPTESAVREDVAVAVVKACGLENDAPEYALLNRFTDKDKITDNLKPYIAIAIKHEIMQGKGGYFDPQENLTRAEVCQIMYNVNKKIKNDGFKVLVSTDENEIPYININSKDVQTINENIKEIYSTYYEDIKGGESIDWSYDYTCNINDNVLTYVVIKHSYGDYISLVAHVDILTGKELSKQEVLNLTDNVYLVNVDALEIYDEAFMDCWMPGYLQDEFIKNKTLPDNVENYIITPYNINDAYNLCVNSYANKKLNDLDWYLGPNKNIIAEISYPFTAGAVENVGPELFNVTELMKKKGNNYYIIENSDKIVINERNFDERNIFAEIKLNYDLRTLSNSELNIAYNEIFARHGHDFQTQNLKEHFNKMLWYKSIEGKTVMLEDLNDVERENARIIKGEIEERNKILKKIF